MRNRRRTRTQFNNSSKSRRKSSFMSNHPCSDEYWEDFFEDVFKDVFEESDNDEGECD